MHTLLKVQMTDVEAANDSIRDGRLEKILKQVSELIKPEATFFYAENGFRTALMIFDLQDSSLIPQIAEPIFTGLNAKVDLYPAMSNIELQKGLASWNKTSSSHVSLS